MKLAYYQQLILSEEAVSPLLLTKDDLDLIKAMLKIDKASCDIEAVTLINLPIIMNSRENLLSPNTLLNYLMDRP